jgi:hypothetical protein
VPGPTGGFACRAAGVSTFPFGFVLILLGIALPAEPFI